MPTLTPALSQREREQAHVPLNRNLMRWGLRHLLTMAERYASTKSNTAMLSTCAVCGNMLTMPAAEQR